MSEDIPEGPGTASQARVLAREIADALKESNIALIYRIITVIGPERTKAFLREALELEAQNGLLRKDGKRRTPGGTFFFRVRSNLPAAERKQLWLPGPRKKQSLQRASAQADTGLPTPKAKLPPVVSLTWEEAKQLGQQALEAIGEAKTVKLTLIGRPSKIVQQAHCVVIAMKGKEPASLPKGLPTPPANSAITWAVFIVNKQWNAVKDSVIGNPEDNLIVEGYPIIDPKSGSSVVLAISCKSVVQERAAREAKKGAT